MLFVDLVLTVCLIANPDACREERLMLESNGVLASCMYTAPARIARWTQEHPKLVVKRWKCMFPDERRDI